jgi:hypothetical protein
MKKFLIIVLLIPVISGCWVYSFSGTSIAPDVNTITINYIQNKAMRVNPSLSNTITEALKDKYRKLTKLKLQPEKGDLVVEGDIVSYETKSLSVTAQEVAAQNRLTIIVKIKFTNTKHPDDDFERPFEAFEDYPSTTSLDQVEARLVDSIVEKLVENIFNDTVAKW